MTDAVPTRTPTALTRRHPQRVVPAEQMTAADQRPGRYLTHGARDASTRPVRPAGNSRGGAGIAAVGGVEGGHGHHRARTSAALAGPAPEVPSGLLLRTFRASRTHRDVDRIPSRAFHAPPIGVAIDPLSCVEYRRPLSRDPPPDGAGPANADRPRLDDDPRPPTGDRGCVTETGFVTSSGTMLSPLPQGVFFHRSRLTSCTDLYGNALSLQRRTRVPVAEGLSRRNSPGRWPTTGFGGVGCRPTSLELGQPIRLRCRLTFMPGQSPLGNPKARYGDDIWAP